MIKAKMVVLAFLAYNFLTVIPVSAATETIIHSFGNVPDGVNPRAGLLNVNGTLYGTTSSGGATGSGTIYRITPAGKETVLYSFGTAGADGLYPEAPLVQVGDAVYGTTYEGGSQRGGTVFKFSAQGEQIVYSFGSNAGDGLYPRTGLIYVGDALYGTTSEGGSSRNGTVFKIALNGQETTLHSFGDCAPSLADGCEPVGRLLYVNGAVFGVTGGGGFGGGGVVYRLNGTSETILHSFGPGAGGEQPDGGVIDVNGVLYGTTSRGGENSSGEPTNGGTVYSLDLSGSEKLLYTFDKSRNIKNDGVFPQGELLDVNGMLFGDTEEGGSYKGGTVFALLPDGSRETVLNSLHGSALGSLINVTNMLYGTTVGGGKHSNGTVFGEAP